MTGDAKLPPLPYPQIPGNDYDALDMWDYAHAAIKAYRQQRGEPVAWQYWDGSFWTTTIDPEGHRINGRAVRPLYASPQPADINIDYKQMFDQMCERCDALDAKLAEYSEQPTPAAQEPNAPDPMKYDGKRDDQYVTGWNDCLAAMLAAAPKFGEEE